MILRRFPARADGDDIFVDLAEPDPAELIERAWQDCMIASTAMSTSAWLVRSPGCRWAATRWTQFAGPFIDHDRFEFGSTVAVAADWLALRDAHIDDPAKALAA